MSEGERFRAYDERALQPVLDAMARRLGALLDATPATLLGLQRRGAPLAEMLHARLRALAPHASIERMDLVVKRYADHLELLHPETRLDAPPGAAFAGRRVIVVDDVLYQGHSLQRVFEWLRTHSPAALHGAVLVDRCCALLPVRADVVGIALQVAPHDVVECNVPPFEPELAIDIWRPSAPTR